MRTAPRAAAWAAWGAWICNRAIAGGAAAGNDRLRSKRAGFGPLFLLCCLDASKRVLRAISMALEAAIGIKSIWAGGTAPPIATCGGAPSRKSHETLLVQ